MNEAFITAPFTSSIPWHVSKLNSATSIPSYAKKAFSGSLLLAADKAFRT